MNFIRNTSTLLFGGATTTSTEQRPHLLIDSFPEELIQSIFSQLNVWQLNRCGRVSKQWSRLADESCLWEKVSLSLKLKSQGPLQDPIEKRYKECLKIWFLNPKLGRDQETIMSAGSFWLRDTLLHMPFIEWKKSFDERSTSPLFDEIQSPTRTIKENRLAILIPKSKEMILEITFDYKNPDGFRRYPSAIANLCAYYKNVLSKETTKSSLYDPEIHSSFEELALFIEKTLQEHLPNNKTPSTLKRLYSGMNRSLGNLVIGVSEGLGFYTFIPSRERRQYPDSF